MRVNIHEIPDELRNAIDRVASTGARIGIELSNGSIAGLVPLEDLELAQRVEDCIDNQAADAALAEGGEVIPWEVVKKALNL